MQYKNKIWRNRDILFEVLLYTFNSSIAQINLGALFVII